VVLQVDQFSLLLPTTSSEQLKRSRFGGYIQGTRSPYPPGTNQQQNESQYRKKLEKQIRFLKSKINMFAIFIETHIKVYLNPKVNNLRGGQVSLFHKLWKQLNQT
jgi:hypothetical protein